MNCLTLEKTLVPLALCQVDTKEKPMVLKRRCKEMTKGTRVDLGTVKRVQVCLVWKLCWNFDVMYYKNIGQQKKLIQILFNRREEDEA